jgi:hypothetical protein
MIEASSSLRPGDWVEVRSKEEILATLDANGRLDGLPFMPEMLQSCGKRLRVFQRAHKTCDTVTQTGGRRMSHAVHLEDSRCDGAAHSGCEASCLLFWKDAWLKPIDGKHANGATAPRGAGCSEAQLQADTRNGTADGEPVYACQATRLLEATTPLAWWEMGQYLEDYRSGNVGAVRILRGALYVCTFELIRLAGVLGKKLKLDIRGRLVRVYDAFQRLIGGTPFPRKFGTIPAGQPTPAFTSNLQPGELVRIKSQKEILATLDDNGKNKGMYFDAEHVPFCEKTFKVRSKVNRIIHERTGKMLNFKQSSVILDGVWCESRYSAKRMFCPRAIYPYWREIWLERVSDPPAQAATKPVKESNGSAVVPPPPTSV